MYINCQLYYCNSIMYNVHKNKTIAKTSESMCAHLEKILLKHITPVLKKLTYAQS